MPAKSTKKPTAKAKKPVTRKKKPASVKYMAVKNELYHPFQRVKIHASSPGVILELDSWLKSQIERGLIKEV